MSFSCREFIYLFNLYFYELASELTQLRCGKRSQMLHSSLLPEASQLISVFLREQEWGNNFLFPLFLLPLSYLRIIYKAEPWGHIIWYLAENCELWVLLVFKVFNVQEIQLGLWETLNVLHNFLISLWSYSTHYYLLLNPSEIIFGWFWALFLITATLPSHWNALWISRCFPKFGFETPLTCCLKCQVHWVKITNYYSTS